MNGPLDNFSVKGGVVFDDKGKQIGVITGINTSLNHYRSEAQLTIVFTGGPKVPLAIDFEDMNTPMRVIRGEWPPPEPKPPEITRKEVIQLLKD
jgi:hypothetical protein